MPFVTFFCVLERPGKNRKGGFNDPLGSARVNGHNVEKKLGTTNFTVLHEETKTVDLYQPRR